MHDDTILDVLIYNKLYETGDHTPVIKYTKSFGGNNYDLYMIDSSFFIYDDIKETILGNTLFNHIADAESFYYGYKISLDIKLIGLNKKIILEALENFTKE